MQWARKHDRPAFDTWLNGQLHALHDATLREQVPEEMLRLLDALPDHR